MSISERTFSVTLNGKLLDPSLYAWNPDAKIFATKQDNLVLDFTNWFEATFKTGSCCIFKTGDDCTFHTGQYCTFITGNNCKFETGQYCTFMTGQDCMFKTDQWSIFKSGGNCEFDIKENCLTIDPYNYNVTRS